MITQEQLASVAGLSSRDAAAKLGVGKSTINDARDRYRMKRPLPEPTNLVVPVEAPKPIRVLALDLETSPNVAHVWGLWQQNVSIKQLLASTEVICFGARWIDEPDVVFRSVHHDGKEAMLAKVHEMLDEADAVMGWNSAGFDSKHLNREFIENGLLPPSPWKELDLMLAVKRVFRFPSNKLDYVAQKLGVGHKVQHSGHEMWIKCLAGDEEAWAEMKAYQIQDVDLLIDLWEKLRPWYKGPVFTAHGETESLSCSKCGSTNLQRRGHQATVGGKYRKYQCQDCGGWSRSAKAEFKGTATRPIN